MGEILENEKEKKNENEGLSEEQASKEDLASKMMDIPREHIGEKISEVFDAEIGIDSPGVSLMRLKKSGKVLMIVSKVLSICAQVASILLTVVGVILLIPKKYWVLSTNGESIDIFVSIDASGMDIINRFPTFGDIPANVRFSIIAFLGALICLSVFLLMRQASLLFKAMISEKQPFTREIAKKVHLLIIYSIPLVIWNTFTGLAIVFIMILFSAVFDYGVYLQELSLNINHIQEDVILSLAEITEARSGQTGQHVKRVAEYTYIMAKELDYTDEMAEKLKYASMMHDVGKISIPLEILEKPGKLTNEEFDVIKTHTTEGERLLHNARGEIMSLGAAVANEHHEKWDGKGYPLNKAGEEISKGARIVAVADVFDALTSRRSYKDAWDAQDAFDEIVKCSGTQFDPEVVECFKKCFSKLCEVREQYSDGGV